MIRTLTVLAFSLFTLPLIAADYGNTSTMPTLNERVSALESRVSALESRTVAANPLCPCGPACPCGANCACLSAVTRSAPIPTTIPVAAPVAAPVPVTVQPIRTVQPVSYSYPVAAPVAAPSMQRVSFSSEGSHSHKCPRCGTVWGGQGHSHNCPNCGTYQNVVYSGSSYGSSHGSSHGSSYAVSTPRYRSSVGPLRRLIGFRSSGGSCANGNCAR